MIFSFNSINPQIYLSIIKNKIMSEFEKANYHGEVQKCNWCGSDEISQEITCLISDLPHTIYLCEDCEKRTSKKKLSTKTVWKPAVKEKNEAGISRHIIAGSK